MPPAVTIHVEGIKLDEKEEPQIKAWGSVSQPSQPTNGEKKWKPCPLQIKDASWRWSCCNCVLIGMVSFIVLLNLLKIPFYFVDLPANSVTYDASKCALAENAVWCRGIEGAPWLRHLGYRGNKMLANPQNFLGPHAAMGCLLLGMWALGLLGTILGGTKPWSIPNYKNLTYHWMILLFIFSVHIFPVAHGTPNRQTGLPVNHSAGVLCILASGNAILARAVTKPKSYNKFFGFYHKHSSRIQWWCWVVGVCCLLAAPLIELPGFFVGVFTKIGSGSFPDSSETVPEQPLSESGQDMYALMDNTYIGWVAAFCCLMIPITFAIKLGLRRYKFPKFEWKHMLTPEPREDDTKDKMREDKEYTCGFRKLGLAVLVLFLMAVALGFILTLTMTRFTMENDYVFQYFGMPNPCVVFDHYPAKVWALIFTSFMLVMATAWAGLLWLWIWSKQMLQEFTYSTLLITVHLWYMIQFINIYATDLYADEKPDSGYGVQNGILTEEDKEVVGSHTNPYINLLFADSALMLYQCHLIRILEKTPPNPQNKRWKSYCNRKWTKLYILFFLTMCVFATFTTLSGAVYYKTAQVSGQSDASIVMTSAVMASKLQSSVWSVVGQLGYRMCFSSEWKVRARFSNIDKDQSWSRIDPDTIFSLSFRFLALVICLTFMYSNPNAKADVGESVLQSSAFTTKPGVLIFAPAIVLLTITFAIGVWLTYVRMALWEKGLKWPKWRKTLSLILAILFVLNIPLAMWRILPEADWTTFLDYPLFFFFVLWSFVSHAGMTARCIVYDGTVAFCMGMGFLHWSFRVFALALLCFYRFGSDGFPNMYIQVTALGARDEAVHLDFVGDNPEEEVKRLKTHKIG